MRVFKMILKSSLSALRIWGKEGDTVYVASVVTHGLYLQQGMGELACLHPESPPNTMSASNDMEYEKSPSRRNLKIDHLSQKRRRSAVLLKSFVCYEGAVLAVKRQSNGSSVPEKRDYR
jgi:hypothetical protein